MPPAVVNADWSHRNGAAGGRLVNPALRPVPQLIWSVDIGAGDAKRARLLTGPIVAGGLIYAMDAAGQLTAVTRRRPDRLDAAAWCPRGRCPDSGPGGGMAMAGGVLFVDHRLRRGLRARSARPAGRSGGGRSRRRSARRRRWPAGGCVVVQRDDTAYALDARSGETLWRVQGIGGTGLLGGASPAVGRASSRCIPFASGEVLGVLARNGLTVWGTAVTGGRREFARNGINDISGDPVIDGGVVYASNQSGRTIRLDAQTGERAWTIAGGLLRPGLAGRRLGLPALRRGRAGARRRRDRRAPLAGAAAGVLPEPRASSAAASPSRRSPTTGRSSPAGGSGWPAPTGCCAPSARPTARCWRRCRCRAAPRRAPAVAGRRHVHRHPRRPASGFSMSRLSR